MYATGKELVDVQNPDPVDRIAQLAFQLRESYHRLLGMAQEKGLAANIIHQCALGKLNAQVVLDTCDAEKQYDFLRLERETQGATAAAAADDDEPLTLSEASQVLFHWGMRHNVLKRTVDPDNPAQGPVTKPTLH